MTRQSITSALLFAMSVAARGGGEEAPEEAPAAEAPAPAPVGLIDPNTASEEQLRTIEGIDSTTAAAIVAGRPYTDMVAVNAQLPGAMSDAERDRVYERLWYPLDLNSASEEEIMLIPRVGAQLAEEFEEYRPYDSIERFRREIGKYVDPAEVTRLEQYVTIR